MPNLRRSIVGALDELGPAFAGARGIFLQGSDGRTVTILRAQILARFALESGTILQRKVATVLWFRQQIIAALGAEQISLTSITTDFDESNGEISGLTVGA